MKMTQVISHQRRQKIHLKANPQSNNKISQLKPKSQSREKSHRVIKRELSLLEVVAHVVEAVARSNATTTTWTWK